MAYCFAAKKTIVEKGYHDLLSIHRKLQDNRVLSMGFDRIFALLIKHIGGLWPCHFICRFWRRIMWLGFNKSLAEYSFTAP